MVQQARLNVEQQREERALQAAIAAQGWGPHYPGDGLGTPKPVSVLPYCPLMRVCCMFTQRHRCMVMYRHTHTHIHVHARIHVFIRMHFAFFVRLFACQYVAKYLFYLVCIFFYVYIGRFCLGERRGCWAVFLLF